MSVCASTMVMIAMIHAAGSSNSTPRTVRGSANSQQASKHIISIIYVYSCLYILYLKNLIVHHVGQRLFLGHTCRRWYHKGVFVCLVVCMLAVVRGDLCRVAFREWFDANTSSFVRQTCCRYPNKSLHDRSTVVGKKTLFIGRGLLIKDVVKGCLFMVACVGVFDSSGVVCVGMVV